MCNKWWNKWKTTTQENRTNAVILIEFFHRSQAIIWYCTHPCHQCGKCGPTKPRTCTHCVCVPNDTKQINVNVYWTRIAFDDKNRKSTKTVNKNLFFPFNHSNGRACVHGRETERETEHIWIVFVIFKSRQFHSHITNYRSQFRHPWQCTHCYCFGTMHEQKMRTSFGPVMASTTIAVAITQSQPISLRSFSSSSWRWFSFFLSGCRCVLSPLCFLGWIINRMRLMRYYE